MPMLPSAATFPGQRGIVVQEAGDPSEQGYGRQQPQQTAARLGVSEHADKGIEMARIHAGGPLGAGEDAPGAAPADFNAVSLHEPKPLA
ncbi:MAG: hypothetical protein KC442_05540 [Thermomicrobiales bacterium]|nr:hypothetical protein [Thermomicrobiales bacterium]